MDDRVKHDELNRALDEVISGGEFASTGDEELDAMARLAVGLRGLPDPDFKARLWTSIMPAATSRPAWRAVMALPVVSWFRGQRVFLAGGSSCGLVAGACCISGAAANVLGIASAAAVTAFIDSTLPYFIALSIVSMAVWLAWVLRDRGFTLLTLGQTVRRHGIALGGAYGAVFGASMALTMLMGLQ